MNKVVSLAIRCAALVLKNPLIAAAGPNTKNYEIVKKGIDAGCGAVVVRGVHLKSPDEKPASIREFWNIYHSDRNFRDGLYSFQSAATPAHRINKEASPGVGGTNPRPTLGEWTEQVRKMVRYAHAHDCFIIASIGWCGDCFPSAELWKNEATAMKEGGVDALELHTGPCPTTEPGRYLQANPEKYLKNPIRVVREVTDLPLLVKLPVDCCDVISLAQIAEEAGAHAVVPTTRWMSLNVDSERERDPIWPGLMGYGGNWSLPILSAYVYRMRRGKPGTENLGWGGASEGQYYKKVNIPIIASGGVDSGEDVVKLILAGADGVEICTQILLEGYETVGRMLREIKQWMQKKGYQTLSDLAGTARLVEEDHINGVCQPVAVIDEELCNGCRRCLAPCTNEAIIFMEEVGKAKILADRCEGCGTCSYICQQGAISLQELPEPKLKKTVGERQIEKDGN